MYSVYDEQDKQWGTLDVEKFIKSDESLGQKLLDVLAKHDSKVAQVYFIQYCTIYVNQICPYSVEMDFSVV